MLSEVQLHDLFEETYHFALLNSVGFVEVKFIEAYVELVFFKFITRRPEYLLHKDLGLASI